MKSKILAVLDIDGAETAVLSPTTAPGVMTPVQ